MKDLSNGIGLLNDKYIIKSKLGEGGYSTVYEVINSSTNKEYAAKIVEQYCRNEIKVNQKLAGIQSPYIIKYVEYSQGTIKMGNDEDYMPYFIFELATKGDLSKYLECGKNGFSEEHSKFISYEILKAFQEIHKAGICHRDIKAENILLDTDDYHIKICDFGFSSDSSELQSGLFGTKCYMAPEIIMDKEYDGIKADIFSLGVLFLYIRTTKFLFDQAKVTNGTNTTYDYIKNKSDNIWKIAETNLSICGLSEAFKELYLRMVAFNPKERPSIKEIINGEWMKGITNLSENEYMEIKKEVVEEFKEREAIIQYNKEV